MGGRAAAHPAQAEDNPLPLPTTHLAWDGYVALLDSRAGAHGEGRFKNPPNPICSTPPSTAPNVSTDCEAVAPHNETSIAVNPTNTQNLIGGANDYQFLVNAGGPVNVTIYSRAHVSFDGGKTWTMVPLDTSGYVATGDPAVAFDAAGNAYYAMLGFGFGQRSPTGRNPDVVVSHSSDGGAHWSPAVTVAKGTGSFGSPGTFNDKEEIAAWGNGNAIVTYTDFRNGIGGSYGGSPIFASVTHDGGKTWTAPAEIAGSAAFCVGFRGGNACDQDQGSVPVVAADGSIYVAFGSTRGETADFANQYVVVKVDPASGQRVAGPFKVSDVVDGINDYPRNVYGLQTYQDSQFRSWAIGNIAADPTDAQHLAVAWSDMRNSARPAPADPYEAKTNSDVVVSQSTDGGQTWSARVALAASGDQFMPWASYGPDGKLRIGYFDRSYDAANHKFGYTLATESSAGTLAFSTTQLTTALSDPTRDDFWFSTGTQDPAFPNPSSFLGDYSGIDASQGFTAALWTDMRDELCFPQFGCGHGEDAFYATGP
ncbi:MAG: glycoside hydrolase [Chloroflexota bacterium]|nr:glycoside hydrolase [Chloroflexota bacterium]